MLGHLRSQEKNGWKTCKKTRKRDMDAGESTLSLLVSTQRFAILYPEVRQKKRISYRPVEAGSIKDLPKNAFIIRRLG